MNLYFDNIKNLYGGKMKFVLVIGSGAVGKMSVGQEIMKKTKLRLFHNHMMIEPIREIFGEHNGTLAGKLRKIVCEEFAKSDMYGMIFTYMWDFDAKSDWDYIQQIVDIFERNNSDIYCVELFANQSTRLGRNKTENRLRHKASKRDIGFSENRILYEDKEYRLVSYENELPFKNYIRIDNTYLKASEAANIIIDRFNL